MSTTSLAFCWASRARRTDYHASVAGSHFHFVDVVVADRDLFGHECARPPLPAGPRESELAWHCDLDDGTSSSGESAPARTPTSAS